MAGIADASVYTDFSGLTALKAKASRDARGSLAEVARQFESLFLGQMLKSMRQASLGEGILDNDQSLFYRDMFDQQLALHLAGSGGMGLADAIERQLGGAAVRPETGVKGLDAYLCRRTLRQPAPATAPAGEAGGSVRPETADDPGRWDSREFVQRLWPWAVEAAKQLGLRPQALLAQAALETGWGQYMLRRPDGAPSNNLFNIKAGRRWQGPSVAVDSLEYEQGVAVKRRSRFRAYPSLRDSFRDYVAFLRESPRYGRALESSADPAGFFSALQQGGYATDPRYAEKVQAVMEGPEMRRALAALGI
ncbi:MAG TPA: flagellar assembly peptidoglycan hydrolase FlgJ [Sedimenticola thiotaurini]|uniref:Peptidoglycan hydrolase FlgJ n=1 Tax=Sedimenticola thiotaurini TaxID=1543721 RepID=A0A831WA50_9GAMM|nr:flagellar assembly peptidoglycan hydrolase FlgJ [Sedimenticola thiotaurini]